MGFLKKNIISLLILFLSFFIILLAFWITKTFGENIYYVEILYNIHIGYEGFKDAPNIYKINFTLYTIFPAFFLSISTLIISKKIKNIFNFTQTQKRYLWLNKSKNFLILLFSNKYLRILLFNSNIFLIYSLLFFLFQFKFFEYFEKNARFDDYPNLYVNPYTIEYNKFLNQKNLILFYVESLEYHVSKFSSKTKINPIQSFNEIKGKNVYDFKQAPNSSISIAGMVSSQCSLPFNVFINSNFNQMPKEKVFCLSDVLARNNYEQFFYFSVDKKFQNVGTFKERHGYKVYDVNILKKFSDPRTKKLREKLSWGDNIYDSVLLKHAKQEIIKKHKAGKKFNFTIKTTDTHYPYGFPPECIIDDISTQSLQIYEAYKCSGALIKKFVDDLDTAGVLDNTLVVIMGDHLAHGDIIAPFNQRNNQNIYFKMSSNKNFERAKMNHFDVAPTILDELGFLPENNKRFGFGVSLFEDKNKFNYDKHYGLVMRKDILSNFYVRRLMKFIPKTKEKTNSEFWKDGMFYDY